MTRTAPRKGLKSKKGDYGAWGVDITSIRLQLQGWYLRTLNVDTKGDYGKLRRSIEFFLGQAEQQLSSVLWDRATRVAFEEALLHLALRWGPKFRGELQLEIRITDTHLKFSLVVPTDAIILQKGLPTSESKAVRDAAMDNSLYLVRRLMDRLHRAPSGRQLVFRRLLRQTPRL